MASIIVQEAGVGDGERLAKVISSPAPAYAEMSLLLQRMSRECQALLSAFHVEGKLPQKIIPKLTTFTLDTAHSVVNELYTSLTERLGKPLASLEERRRKIFGSIGYYAAAQDRYTCRVGASIAAALIRLRHIPEKHGPLVRALMTAIKVSLQLTHG
jgi:TATA-binding protein-associated factor